MEKLHWLLSNEANRDNKRSLIRGNVKTKKMAGFKRGCYLTKKERVQAELTEKLWLI